MADKITYEVDIVQGTTRIKWKFDTGESSQLNYPLGVEERQIQEDLRAMYEKIQTAKTQPPTVGKKTLNF